MKFRVRFQMTMEAVDEHDTELAKKNLVSLVKTLAERNLTEQYCRAIPYADKVVTVRLVDGLVEELDGLPDGYDWVVWNEDVCSEHGGLDPDCPWCCK